MKNLCSIISHDNRLETHQRILTKNTRPLVRSLSEGEQYLVPIRFLSLGHIIAPLRGAEAVYFAIETQAPEKLTKEVDRLLSA